MSSTHALVTAHYTHLHLIQSGALVPPTMSHSMGVVNNDAGSRLVHCTVLSGKF